MATHTTARLLRAASRSAPIASRHVITSRSIATKAAGPSGSSSNWTIGAAASAAAIGVAAGIYSVQSRQSPLHLEARKSWQERLKPKESKGDASLHKDAHDRHPSSAKEEEPTAEETPQVIEVAVEEVEEEAAGQQSAYDPETGEINWDCPCLGGMAHGPCGEQFKAAFSCFVYSEAEPKGIDCVDKFKLMQDCFRQHPDVYKDEIEDDEAANAAFEKEESEHNSSKEAGASDSESASQDKKESSE